MEWRELLQPRRIGRTAEAGAQPDLAELRTEFFRDWDRIVFCSAFRRLQDKTQVHPLAKTDYVRTRLTHSLEVASVGRSLGMQAGRVVGALDPALRDIASGLATALRDEAHRDAAALTFLVTLSGVSLLGIGSAFWGVVAGTVALLVQQWRVR